MQWISYLLLVTFYVFVTGCGGGSSSSKTETDSKYTIEYKGLQFYHKSLEQSDYKLSPLIDSEFNNLSSENRLIVSNKLLSTLFFGYPQSILEEKVNSGSFLSDLKEGLDDIQIDTDLLESSILDENIFQQSPWGEQEAVDILARFYQMDSLDRYFLHNWIAYILTQTIMFSPAYELESSHTPNITQVYNRIVNLLNEEAGMRYITYIHMSSEDNWRRFRSPEDNGREMLEIFTLDMDDAHVPIAGKALQNWRLDRDSDTLVVGLNHNTQKLSLFDTDLYTGDDFYRELVKSELFVNGVTSRLIDFFFPNYTDRKKDEIKSKLIASHPESWQDILLQIIFSKEYLLYNSRAKSAEESFFSLAKKMDFKHRTGTFHQFKRALEGMHQATMKYKLGKLQRVPLDTLSFVSYYKYVREELLLSVSNPEKLDDYTSWGRQGWSKKFIEDDGIDYTNLSNKESLSLFIEYLFKTLVYRNPTSSEFQMFFNHMLEGDAGREEFTCCFDMFEERDDMEKQNKARFESKSRVARVVLEYLARLDDLYMQKEVN